MPRFVLLRHLLPATAEKSDHWDFMLESAGRLLTWNLDELPARWGVLLSEPTGPDNAVAAVGMADHRLAYLDYEGPISGDRGTVSSVDGGTYRAVQWKSGVYRCVLAGKHLRGEICLEQSDGPTWQLTARCDATTDAGSF